MNMGRKSGAFVVATMVVAALVGPLEAAALCFGDLDADARVSIGELMVLVGRRLDPAKNPTFPPTPRPTRTRNLTPNTPRPTRTPLFVEVTPNDNSVQWVTQGQGDIPEGRTRKPTRTPGPPPIPEPVGAGQVRDIGDIIRAVRHSLFGCPPRECEARGPLGRGPNTDVQETVIGINGVFTDDCGIDGTLIEWRCQKGLECGRWGPGPNMVCEIYDMGIAEPVFRECSGGCVAGTCLGRCPTIGDELVYLELGQSSASFRNEVDHRVYDCTLTSCGWQRPAVGDRVGVTSSGPFGEPCTARSFGRVRLDNLCRYECGIREGSDLPR